MLGLDSDDGGAPLRIAGLVLLLSGSCILAAERAETAKWESEILAFEASDRTNPPPQRAILFLGSSSIRLWKTLTQDFEGLPVINRGFGGSEIEDATRWAGQIVIPYRPRKIVFYAGDNDIAAGKSPDRVLADYKAFVRKIEPALPGTTLAFIAIKPSPSRWKHAERIRAANQLIARYSDTDPRLSYIDVFTPMLGENGMPRPELFVADQLHLNAKGYALWTSIIRPHLR